jgi:preprotein translocase subunit YajC
VELLLELLVVLVVAVVMMVMLLVREILQQQLHHKEIMVELDNQRLVRLIVGVAVGVEHRR